LPPGLTEEDFRGILKLALLTECATDSYSAVIGASARRFDVPWLGRFNERVWAPDERTHLTPYKLFLLQLGFSEAELDRDIEETRQRQYVHFGGETPVHVTTFGMIQEYLTDSWHGLISELFREAAPEARHMVLRIKRRETLHTAWYRDMTALQIEANPAYVQYVASEVAGFHMPSMSLVPELHLQARSWQHVIGADFEGIFRDLLRLVQSTLNSVRLTGELVITLAAEKKIKLGPISSRQLAVALRRLGGPGYGIIGEAVLERAGLSYIFRRPNEGQDSAFEPYGGAHERIRGLVRSWVASHLPDPAPLALGV
jgi:hypothetical protein